MRTLVGRRQIGLAAWFGLALATTLWLWDAGASVHWSIWPVLLAPFLLLLPGMLKPSRNTWLLALLASIGYATTGLMDAIANPNSLSAAAILAVVALAAFFLLIPAIRTIPSAQPDQ